MSDSSVTAAEQELAPFNTLTAVLVQPIVNLTVMLYVFGVYTVLFIISLRVLLRRQDHRSRALYMFFTIALFTLTGAVNIVEIFVIARQATLEFKFSKNRDWASWLAYLQNDSEVGTIETGLEMVMPVCLVTMADLMLLHRCYVIWGYSKRVVFPIIFFMVSLTVCYVIGATFTIIGASNYGAKQQLYDKGNIIEEAYWFASIGISIILTGLTAGRIWWVSRGPQKHMEPAIRAKYNMIIAIILESGALYPIFLTATILVDTFTDPDNRNTQPLSLWIVTYQLAGIAPTLVIIRTAGAKIVEHTSSNRPLSSLHCVEGGSPGSFGDSDTISYGRTVGMEDSSESLAEGRKSSGDKKAA
ncbi:hypothetical protein Moror_5963 [Moniliophthora roreri MCA 2997]|uniref:Uncharacterized protein n=2 Tax=Moniliophthora roreri TaxID=221103 RepID=V2WXU5_MONRO|nr:hypothetical protein Moror_5963 [Moniliophthora roreri MCA 2997]KAI3614933.1 hypothetical protein WG66_016788 [Moniliophthora roreri]